MKIIYIAYFDYRKIGGYIHACGLYERLREIGEVEVFEINYRKMLKETFLIPWKKADICYCRGGSRTALLFEMINKISQNIPVVIDEGGDGIEYNKSKLIDVQYN